MAFGEKIVKGASAVQKGANIGLKTLGGTLLSELGMNVGLGMVTNMALGGMSGGQALRAAAGQAAIFAVAPGAAWAYTAIEAAKTLGEAYIGAGPKIMDKYNQRRRELSSPMFSYQDTQQALTMRQAAIQAIQGSKLNARSALGGEAALMHRGFNKRV